MYYLLCLAVCCDDDDDDDDDDVICSTYGVTPDRVNRPKVISHTLNV